MKKHRSILLTLMLAFAMLTGCGGAANDKATGTADGGSWGGNGSSQSAPQEMYDGDFLYSDTVMEEMETGGTDGAAQIHLPNMPVNGREKIIYTTHLDIESLAFDENYNAIIAHLDACGGYIANSEMSGGVYSDGTSRSRHVWLELKVPVENYRTFLSGENFGNIVFRNDSSENITNAYMDVEARLSTLQVQENRLLQLLEESGTLEELLALEERLAEVRYEIELLTSRRNAFDEQVRYCTVTVNLDEVRRVTVASDTFGARLRAAVADSLDSVVEFFKDFVVFLIYLLPVAVIVGVVVFLAVIAVRRIRRRPRREKAKSAPTPSGTEDRDDSKGDSAPRIL